MLINIAKITSIAKTTPHKDEKEELNHSELILAWAYF